MFGWSLVSSLVLGWVGGGVVGAQVGVVVQVLLVGAGTAFAKDRAFGIGIGRIGAVLRRRVRLLWVAERVRWIVT